MNELCINCIFYDFGEHDCKSDGIEPNDYCGRFAPKENDDGEEV